ncbi:MAG TPA: two-component system response regulator, partial [Candidatus Cloacimonas sp.]|nr:two-component system response regulator [Candidatus Cloacimonas sp.]
MKNKQKIFIVDDEPDILELVAINLEKAGFLTSKYEEAQPMLDSLPKELPDLIILDLMLPDADGFDVCKQLRANSQYKDIPIIMLTAKSEEMDRVLGLEFGADDYVVKPFSPRELVARVKAILRRGTSTATEQSIIEIGDSLSIDTQKYEVKVQNTTVNLTSTEFKLLYLLAKRPGWVYSRNQILDYLWGNDKIVIDRTID